MTASKNPTELHVASPSGPKCDSVPLETALRVPDTFELLTHLKLLDAIIYLKNAIDADGEMNGMKPGQAWDKFCRDAAIKFLEWSRNVVVFENTIPTPPLDILMIWHSYMLNTKDYVHFQNEAFRGRMAGKGIDWQDLVRHLSWNILKLTF